MGVIKRSRHQSNGKKTVHDTKTLNHVSTINIFNSFMTVLITGLRPEVVHAAESISHFVPP